MIGCDARMNYLTNEDTRRLYSYLNESEDRLQSQTDDFNLIWGQKKNESHYYTIPTGQKSVKFVFEGDKSIKDDHVIQDWTIHINDLILNSIGIYDLSNESINECICESLL